MTERHATSTPPRRFLVSLWKLFLLGVVLYFAVHWFLAAIQASVDSAESEMREREQRRQAAQD